jgi:PAS domain S-box-containing protein
MRDHEKTSEQLIVELNAIRDKVSELEEREISFKALGTNLTNIPQTVEDFSSIAWEPDDDLSAEDILQFIDSSQIQSMMDDFYKLTRIGIAIIDLRGRILVATGWQDICTKFHRVNPETRKNCIESDLKLSANVKQGEYRLYRCKNNMWDMATPIIIAGRHVCNLFLGQFLFEGEIPNREEFSAQSERYGFDKEAYLAALDRVPRWDREKVDTVMTFYSKLASLIGQMSYGNVKLSKILESQKFLAESLRQSRDALETIMSSSTVGIAHTRDRIIQWANQAWLRMFGFGNEQEAIGKSARVVYPSDEEFQRAEVVLYKNMQGVEATETDATFQRQDGSTFDGHIRIRAIDSVNPDRGFIASITDISDRKKSERELKLSEERLELAIEGAHLGVWDVNLLTGRSAVNSRTADIIGSTLDEIAPTLDFWQAVIHPEDKARTLELLNDHLNGFTDFFEHEYRVRSKSGDYKWLLARGKVIECDSFGNATRMAGTFMDVTDLKKAQQEKESLYEQLLQAQKMEALGTLVGGIAHDFNNMLQIIMGYSQLLLMGKTQAHEDYQDIQSILFTAQQQADLVKRLLQFARQASVDPLPLDLNSRITELANVMFKTFPRMIDTKLDLSTDLKRVMADGIQMDQVIMNLAINARDAMPDGGALTIATKNVILGEGGYRAIYGAKPGSYVAVVISDTGNGIDDDHLKKIFEPFFSTKQRGTDRGTGLGLSVVKGIVEQHGGHIICESAPGKGTQFTVLLPSIEVSEVEDKKAEA